MHSMCDNENIPMCGKRIDHFRIPHNTLLLPPKYCIFELLSSKMQYSQDHLKTMVYAKIWGANRLYYRGFENERIVAEQKKLLPV